MPQLEVHAGISALDQLADLKLRELIDVSHGDQIQEICNSLVLSDEQLRQMMFEFNAAMDLGLSKEGASKSSMRMLPSYVRSVPDGSEKGDFLALDLGGTNFRVLLIRIIDRQAEMTGKIFRVPDHFMKGTGEALFDHIADCLAQFMEENGLKNSEKKLPLGFTFSFPCSQEGLTSAKLVTWTKGFSASGVENEDVVGLLVAACRRRGDVEVDIVAFLNDTIGTLMACAFEENSCQVGVIVGTGTNACYMEKLHRCEKLDHINPEEDGNPDEMIINTEWCAFGERGELDFLRCSFDDLVDENTINPGKQLFEKMVSGMYLGELVRVVLEKLARENLLFGGDYAAISQHGCFPTKYLSEIESELLKQIEEEEESFVKTFTILEDIGVQKVTVVDCANVAYVCSLVSMRAANLIAAGIATLLRRMEKEFVTVGVDGSVYRFHPTFPRMVDEKIAHLLNGKRNFQLMLSEDGSGKGAALVAAVAHRMKCTFS